MSYLVFDCMSYLVFDYATGPHFAIDNGVYWEVYTQGIFVLVIPHPNNTIMFRSDNREDVLAYYKMVGGPDVEKILRRINQAA